MDRNGIFALLLLFLFVSDAALFGSSRKLVDEEAPKNNSTTRQNSPLPSPVPDTKSSSDAKPTESEKSSPKSRESPLPNNNSSSPDPNGLDKSDSTSPPPRIQPGNERSDTKAINGTVPTNPPPSEQVDNQDHGKGSDKAKPLSPPPSPPKLPESGKNGEESDKGSPPPAKIPARGNDDKGKSKAGNAETCPGMSNRCRDEKSLVACTLSIERGSAKWLILVQNEGEEPLKANIILLASMKNPLKELTIPKHQSQRVNVPISGDADKIIVDAGHGECVLHLDPSVPEESGMFIHLPSYGKLVTPINGAYFLIFSVVVFGGTWACCLFRKKTRGDGIPYQELEMAASEGQSARDVETAEGWDEGWDDDWDEDNAVKSPGGGGRHAKNINISANGLTARASNRDGWEDDWHV